MRVAELDYALPPELIARYPAARREDARLLLVGDPLRHTRVAELSRHLPAGALLVFNDTRVIRARVFGHKESGGRVELLLVRRLSDEPQSEDGPGALAGAERWQALGKASKPIRRGISLQLDGEAEAWVEAGVDEEGLLTLRVAAGEGRTVLGWLDEVGELPLPPYLDRRAEPEDDDRYQTRLARVPGAVAAPTAGLHFGADLLASLDAAGIVRTAVTLHVGPGTFRPVKTDDLDDHPMHIEHYEVSVEAAAAIHAARQRDAPVVAVGTTVVRTLESAADPSRSGEVLAGESATRLLIQPGYRFRVVDGLMTNFHLPRSTLLALVYAFAGTARTQRAYQAAIEERYRFYSYGDAMLIPQRSS